MIEWVSVKPLLVEPAFDGGLSPAARALHVLGQVPSGYAGLISLDNVPLAGLIIDDSKFSSSFRFLVERLVGLGNLFEPHYWR